MGRIVAGCPIMAELAAGVAGPVPVGLAAVELTSVRLGAGGPEAGEMFVADCTGVPGVTAAAGDVSFLGGELGVGGSDLDLRLTLGVERCWPKLRILTDTRSSTLFFPDLPPSLSDIVRLLLGRPGAAVGTL